MLKCQFQRAKASANFDIDNKNIVTALEPPTQSFQPKADQEGTEYTHAFLLFWPLFSATLGSPRRHPGSLYQGCHSGTVNIGLATCRSKLTYQ